MLLFGELGIVVRMRDQTVCRHAKSSAQMGTVACPAQSIVVALQPCGCNDVRQERLQGSLALKKKASAVAHLRIPSARPPKDLS
jgi:hypothetical protein